MTAEQAAAFLGGVEHWSGRARRNYRYRTLRAGEEPRITAAQG